MKKCSRITLKITAASKVANISIDFCAAAVVVASAKVRVKLQLAAILADNLT